MRQSTGSWLLVLILTVVGTLLASDLRGADPTLRFPSDPEFAVVHYVALMGDVGVDTDLHFWVYGDGHVRLEQPYPSGPRVFEMELSFEEVTRLLEGFSSWGVMVFDQEDAERQLQAEKERQLRDRKPVPLVSDLGWEALEVHLQDYTLPGSREPIEDFEKSISVRGLAAIAEHYPEVQPFHDLNSAFSQIRALARDPRLGLEEDSPPGPSTGRLDVEIDG